MIPRRWEGAVLEFFWNVLGSHCSPRNCKRYRGLDVHYEGEGRLLTTWRRNERRKMTSLRVREMT